LAQEDVTNDAALIAIYADLDIKAGDGPLRTARKMRSFIARSKYADIERRTLNRRVINIGNIANAQATYVVFLNLRLP
jgi:hypothetical protein